MGMAHDEVKPGVCVVSTGMPFVHGGAELRALRHVGHLREKENIDAMLVAWDHGIVESRNGSLGAYVFPVSVWTQELTSGPRMLRIFYLGLHIFEIYLRLSWLFFWQRKRINVVHVIFAFSWFNLVAVSVARLFGFPVILEMVAFRTDDPLTLNRRAGQVEKQIFPHQPLKYHLFLQANAYVSKSHALTEAYKQAGLPLDKLQEIASGVNTEMFRPAIDEQEKMDFRDMLGLERDGLHTLYVGRIHPAKGLTELVAAFSQISDDFPQARLWIAGPVIGAQKDYALNLQEQIETLGLTEKVCMLDRVDNVNEYLRAVDLFVLPTKHEGFSGAILEAMASGLPILTSDIPEISQSQIQAGEEGMLVAVDDISALAAAFAKLMADADERRRLGQNALSRVKRDFTQDRIMTMYMALYQRYWRVK